MLLGNKACRVTRGVIKHANDYNFAMSAYSHLIIQLYKYSGQWLKLNTSSSLKGTEQTGEVNIS
jgi:hypothetical protein